MTNLKHAFVIAMLGAYSILFSSTATAAEFNLDDEMVDFGNVDLGDSVTIRVDVRSGFDRIEDVTVQLSGISRGISFITNPSRGTNNNCGGSISGGIPGRLECLIFVTFTPLNYGTKKKRLFLDGVIRHPDGTEIEVSSVVRITGRSDNPKP